MGYKFNKFGWKPDTPDKRDRYMIYKIDSNKLPKSVDLRSKMPPIYDQGELGSCTGQCIAADCHYQMIKQGNIHWQPSALFIYYNERVISDTVNQDSGAELRDGMKAIEKWGICKEDLWKYNIRKFKKKPHKECYDDAIKNRIVDYKRVPQSLDFLKSCLASDDPFVFGFMIYDSFQSMRSDGIMHMPHVKENALGGHAVLAVGYDDDKQVFIIRNSWGKDWGDQGYFYMPYNYIKDSDLAADFWTVTFVPNP
jgi:C1A family cysteine protease